MQSVQQLGGRPADLQLSRQELGYGSDLKRN